MNSSTNTTHQIIPDLTFQKLTELHVHFGGCLYAEDLLELGSKVFNEIDFSEYIQSYREAYGTTPDPIELFQRGLTSPKGAKEFQDHFVFSAEDGGSFERFQAKFNFLISICKYWMDVRKEEEIILQKVVERHGREGLKYVEYRSMHGGLPYNPYGFISFHKKMATFLKGAKTKNFNPRYIISLPRAYPVQGYRLIRQLLSKNPELIPVIVGIDFCFFEEGYPPKSLKTFFKELNKDNQKTPVQALQVTYHVGEVYFDKSLESAIRWCHEAALMGARRLGHAIALGLDPQISINRQPQAHESEPVSERLDQITYDLTHQSTLQTYGIPVDRIDLLREQEELKNTAHKTITRPYTPERLEEIRRRQQFVIDRLVELKTVIECCPTSNLRIGCVPSPEVHPVHAFLRSDLNLVISADDPGIFNSSLASEVEWVARTSSMTREELDRRLGDPARFRFCRTL